jgi:hypothetical protein
MSRDGYKNPNKFGGKHNKTCCCSNHMNPLITLKGKQNQSNIYLLQVAVKNP